MVGEREERVKGGGRKELTSSQTSVCVYVCGQGDVREKRAIAGEEP